jgi:hypothetical protein
LIRKPSFLNPGLIKNLRKILFRGFDQIGKSRNKWIVKTTNFSFFDEGCTRKGTRGPTNLSLGKEKNGRINLRPVNFIIN